MKERIRIVTNGLVKENPSLRLVLGTCPTLAVTTVAMNGLGMGLAATFVLICSNIVISALRKVIPDKVRLPAFITVIATFVTVLQMLVKAYLPSLDTALGIYLPLIVVNCIILGLGMGLGFTLTLVLMGCVRELLGAGTLFGVAVLGASFEPMTLFITPPGGFLVFGVLMALVVFIETKLGARVTRKVGCEGCPAAGACAGACGEEPGKEGA